RKSRAFRAKGYVMKLQSAAMKLARVAGGQLVAGSRAAIAPRYSAIDMPAVLTSYPGQTNAESQVVRLCPHRSVPDGILAVDEDLAGRLGLSADLAVTWELRTDGFRRVQLRELFLELAVEQSLEDVVQALNRDRTLCGTLIYRPDGEDISSISLELGEALYRVRNLAPLDGTGETVFEIVETTQIQVFAPGAKSGVDIVILADCSGSMDFADLNDTSDSTGGGLIRSFLQPNKRKMTRSEALRRSLKHLLDLRLSLPGRVSRIALVAFSTRCVPMFPRDGSMREMDESAPVVLIQEFRDAIGLLCAEQEGTNIGQALQYAAELLHRSGRPGNDRLIV